MPTIDRDATDDGPYPFARRARVQRKDGAYHGAFEFHDHAILQVREVLHRPVFVNTRVSLVSSTLQAAFGVIFVESVHMLISPRRFPVQTIR